MNSVMTLSQVTRMILRRLTHHVRTQNWTAVVLDFLIVVVGVFIGIQMSNWNATRADVRRGAEFTEQLTADLRMEAWSYARLMGYSRDVLAEAERAVGALEGKYELADEALLISAYRATQYLNHQRSIATYEELTSTGSMGLIRNAALRNTAVRLYTTAVFTNIEQEGATSAYRAHFRMSLTNDVQDALARNCGDRVVERGDFEGIGDILGYPCKSGLEDDAIARAAAIIRSDTTLLHHLRRRISDLKTRIGDLTTANRDILEGLRAVAKEMP
jgi:hypothetical protein